VFYRAAHRSHGGLVRNWLSSTRHPTTNGSERAASQPGNLPSSYPHQSVETLREELEFRLDLQNTPERFSSATRAHIRSPTRTSVIRWRPLLARLWAVGFQAMTKPGSCISSIVSSSRTPCQSTTTRDNVWSNHDTCRLLFSSPPPCSLVLGDYVNAKPHRHPGIALHANPIMSTRCAPIALRCRMGVPPYHRLSGCFVFAPFNPAPNGRAVVQLVAGRSLLADGQAVVQGW